MADVDNIISDLEQQRDAIERAIEALREIAGGGTDAPVKSNRPGRPRGSGSAGVSAAPARTKRRLSPEGRNRIVEALKKRWAAKRVAQKAATKKGTKKAVKKAAKTATKKTAPAPE